MSSTTSVCLIIEFNFRFDQNLEKLERVYESRFADRFYLIPFYDGDLSRAIPVYTPGLSHNFQGFFAEALPQIVDKRFTHYIFIADDLLLNPLINSDNILEKVGLDSDSAYIKSFLDIAAGVNCSWCHAMPAISALSQFCYRHQGVEWQKLLPTPGASARLMASHGVAWKPLTKDSLTGYYASFRNYCTDQFVATIIPELDANGEWYPYPLVYGYSDFVIIPARHLKQFCYYCGILAALGVFAEVALPTALLLSCSKITTENEQWKGTEIWESQLVSDLKNKFKSNLSDLMAEFGKQQLYIHPIKLSQWLF